MSNPLIRKYDSTRSVVSEYSRQASSHRYIIQPPPEGASAKTSIINLTNTIMGPGLLVLPYALQQCGLIAGMVLLLVFAFLSAMGLHLLAACARAVPGASFDTMALETIPVLKELSDLFVFINSFGAAICYLIMIGDLMPNAMQTFVELPPDHFFWRREFWIGLFTLMFIVIPASFKNMDSLAFTSALSLFTILYMTVVIVAYAWVPELAINPEPPAMHWGLPDDYSQLLLVLPLFVFAFGCHQVTFQLVDELKDNTLFRCDLVIGSAMAISCLFYLFVAFSGYRTFGNATVPDIISLYPDNVFLAVGRIGLALNMALSYPLHSLSFRNSISVLVLGRPALELSNKVYYTLTYVLLIITVVIAMTVADIAVVLSYCGAIGGTALAFILPGAYYYQYFNEKWHPTRAMAAFMSVFGIMFMPVAVILEAMK
jgi:amino acid permease|uniref:Amino acid transporter transmembrane domain-containing protein n=1 Tax=Eutreptiella gymnastica TaxID=73025 RepID=A0A7S4LJV0_9EUGL